MKFFIIISFSADDTKSVGCSTIHDQIQQPEAVKSTAKTKQDAHQTIASFINKVNFFFRCKVYSVTENIK